MWTGRTFLFLLCGTAILAMLVAIPFSLGAAVFIAEFATGKTREFLKITVELLAAIPSVVWGFIGLAMMNPLIIKTFNVPVGLNVLNAGIILGLMAAPIMTSIAEDALKAVPDRYREAAEGEPAELCLVNTCTVTGEADAKGRQVVRRLARANPGASKAAR